MILLDNSEFMRNGDYVPTRIEAQQDAANLLVGAKTQSHPESTVGLSAGTELLVSPTEDVGKLLNAVHDLQVSRTGGGFGPSPSSSSITANNKTKTKSISDIAAAIQVASLALKHRKNKNGSQRIVLFVGSPLEGVDNRALAKAGRQLKKNNVSIDVVAMGELEVNEDKLKELVDAANGRAAEGAELSCHLVTIPAGVLPSDVLASSPIVHGGSGGSAFAASAAALSASAGEFGSPGGAGAHAEFGGVDPNMDPELAMALRFSMEEERARQERMAAAQASETTTGGGDGGATEESKDAEMQEGASSAASPSAMDLGLSEEEALLQQALAMSMNENEPTAQENSNETENESKPAAATVAASMETEEDDDEAAAMQLALQISLQQAEEEEGAKKEKKQQFQDPQFVNQLLGSLPGVNPNDPAIQNALQNINKDDGDGDKKKDDNKKEEDKKE